jgi:serine/threonine protein kinase
MDDISLQATNSRRRFRVLETIGKGGFGTVYRAEMSDAGGFSKQVALKVMTYDGEASDEIARRMRDEARILGLIRHRAVVGVNSLVPLADGWGVVMEYVAGIDLSTAIKKQRPPPGVVLEVIEEVSAALDAAYTRAVGEDQKPLRLIHRDIKPSNIRITRTGEVKLLDFGVARAEFHRKEAVEEGGFLMGSGRYMAPERRSGEESHRADVYALGIVLANTLSGKRFAEPPCDAGDHARYLGTVLETVRKALQRNNDDQVRAAAHELRMLLLEMLAFHRDDRPDASSVEKRCRKIRKRLPGPWLRDWAERTVPRLEEQAKMPSSEANGDTGRVFDELVTEVIGGGVPSPRPRVARSRSGGLAFRLKMLFAMLGSGLIGFVLGRVL